MTGDHAIARHPAAYSGGRCLFLARDLEFGGAQRQLSALARGLHARERPVTIVLFYGGGSLQEEIERAGVRVRVLGKQGRGDVVGFLLRLRSVIREERPAVVHSYLEVPNLIALLATRFRPRPRLVWGVRATSIETTHYPWPIRWATRVAIRLARFADLVIANSEVAGAELRQRGVRKVVVIPNGIDIDRFRPDDEARRRIRTEWGIPLDAPLVGIVARIDPMKGHGVFLDAAKLVSRQMPESRFVAVGDGDPQLAAALRRRADAIGLGDRIVFHPARGDVAGVYAALDVLCSTSVFGEGFPNVVGEAMACGTPCVVTEVGDSCRVVGDTGACVPSGDARRIADAAVALLRGDRAAVGQRARSRIEELYTVARLVDRTEAALWQPV